MATDDAAAAAVPAAVPAVASPGVEGRARASARNAIIAAVLVGLALRLAIVAISIGTNDATNWRKFAITATTYGFSTVWASTDAMNHPPLPVAWSTVALRLSGGSLHAFSAWLKLPGLLADVGAIAAAGAFAWQRRSPRAGAIVAALLAVNPTSLLIAGYHGNTDGVIGLLTLLAWWAADRGRMTWAAAALAAAINVKFSSTPTVLLLLACTRDRREAARCVGVLAIGALPYLVMTFWAGRPFLENIVGYKPLAFTWLANAAWYCRNVPVIGTPLFGFAFIHRATLAQVTLVIALACTLARRRCPPALPPPLLAGLYWSAFLFWGGGAFQYSIWPMALFTVLRPRLAFAFGALASVHTAWAYAEAFAPDRPLLLLSEFRFAMAENFKYAIPLPLIGAGLLVASLAAEAARRRRAECPSV